MSYNSEITFGLQFLENITNKSIQRKKISWPLPPSRCAPSQQKSTKIMSVYLVTVLLCPILELLQFGFFKIWTPLIQMKIYLAKFNGWLSFPILFLRKFGRGKHHLFEILHSQDSSISCSYCVPPSSCTALFQPPFY